MKTTLRLLGATAIVLIASHVRADIFYVSSQATRHINRVSSAGAVSIFTSLPVGAAYPSGLAFDASGNLFASDPNRNTISKITSTGIVTLFKNLPSGSSPYGIAFDSSGNLYVGNASAREINRITPAGTLSLFATLPPELGTEALAFDASGNLYLTGSNQIGKITPAGAVSLFATLPSGTGPLGLAFDNTGNLYVSGLLTDQVHRVSAGGAVSLFATLPTGTQPVGLAFDSSGNLYAASVVGRVHKITTSGSVSLFASDASESFLRIAVTDDSGQPLALPPATLLGDYNRNGTVDTADYVVWRDGLGTVYNEADYQIWRAHFGSTRGGGSAITTDEFSAAVPEPSAILLLTSGAAFLCFRRHRLASYYRCVFKIVEAEHPGPNPQASRSS